MKHPPLSQATILIVDADPLMLTGVAAVLNMFGHDCHCARDAEAALKAARGLSLDLIICDIDLPDEDGAELCRELREAPGGADAALIVVSQEEAPEAVRRAKELGETWYLRKPFDPDVLLEVVDKALWMPHVVKSRLQGIHLPRAQRV